MRRKRLIVLHNPKLIAIRFNLRTIIKNYYYDQKSILKAHWLGAEGEKQRALLKEIEELRESFRKSIIVCSICSKSDGDRVFYPRLDMWFCKDCLDKGVIPTKRDLS
jgi:hypothetical protein